MKLASIINVVLSLSICQSFDIIVSKNQSVEETNGNVYSWDTTLDMGSNCNQECQIQKQILNIIDKDKKKPLRLTKMANSKLFQNDFKWNNTYYYVEYLRGDNISVEVIPSPTYLVLEEGQTSTSTLTIPEFRGEDRFSNNVNFSFALSSNEISLIPGKKKYEIPDQEVKLKIKGSYICNQYTAYVIVNVKLFVYLRDELEHEEITLKKYLLRDNDPIAFAGFYCT